MSLSPYGGVNDRSMDKVLHSGLGLANFIDVTYATLPVSTNFINIGILVNSVLI